MTIDDLKMPWRSEILTPNGSYRLDVLTSQAKQIRRDVRMRDLLMSVPLLALVVIDIFFNWWTRDSVTAGTRISVLSTLLFAAVVVVALFSARRGTVTGDSTLRAGLEREIESLSRQLTLLLNVGYWFLLPMLAMIVVTSVLRRHERMGSYLPDAMLWALFVASLALCALTAWLCRREARRRFVPLLSRLKELHRDLVTSV